MDVQPSEILSSGTCGCLDCDITQGDDYKQVMSSFDYLEFYIGGFNKDTQRQVVEALCSGVVNLGDLDQSGASMDPLFWPIHPTMERLWQFAVLTGQVNRFDSPDVDVKVTLADGTDVVESISDADVACYGHRGSDVFPYGLLDVDINGFDIKTGIKNNHVAGNNISNREVLEELFPKSDSRTYVYDTFKVDHCVSEGFDFENAWADTSLSPRKTFFQKEGKLPTVYTTFQRQMAERMKEQGGQFR